MTQTMSTSELARQAALAALANLPISDPLELGEPSSDLAQLRFDGVAVTARFTGSRSGDVLIAVERALTDALQNSPLGALDVSAALAPALAAAAGAAGTVMAGPGQPLEPATALAALLGKPGALGGAAAASGGAAGPGGHRDHRRAGTGRAPGPALPEPGGAARRGRRAVRRRRGPRSATGWTCCVTSAWTSPPRSAAPG